VIGCPKYREPILVNGIAETLGSLLEQICHENDWPAISKEIQPEHIHLFLTISLAIAVAQAVKVLKGATARKLLVLFPDLKKKLWGGSLWSPSYYVGTAGNIGAQTI
jgi:putative transposase